MVKHKETQLLDHQQMVFRNHHRLQEEDLLFISPINKGQSQQMHVVVRSSKNQAWVGAGSDYNKQKFNYYNVKTLKIIKMFF